MNSTDKGLAIWVALIIFVLCLIVLAGGGWLDKANYSDESDEFPLQRTVDPLFNVVCYQGRKPEQFACVRLPDSTTIIETEPEYDDADPAKELEPFL